VPRLGHHRYFLGWWQAGLILREGNAPLDVGPQPNYIGDDLNAIADQLIEKYGASG